MKQLSLYLLGLLMIVSCGDKRHTSDSDEDEDEVELQFKQFTYTSPDSSMVVLKAEVPVNGGSPLADSIIHYLDETLAFGFAEFYEDNAKTALQKAGEARLDSLQKEINETRAEFDTITEEMEWTFKWEDSKDISVIANTDRYITYVENGYDYRGGAHPYHWSYGTTFDKKTGQRIDASVLTHTDTPSFKEMFHTSLGKYFEMQPGESLSDYLLIDIADLKPTNVYFTDKEVVFQYQPYEISYYAAGAPCATFTFKQIKPYLSKKGLRLIEEEDDVE